jgi:hypothetical protein
MPTSLEEELKVIRPNVRDDFLILKLWIDDAPITEDCFLHLSVLRNIVEHSIVHFLLVWCHYRKELRIRAFGWSRFQVISHG